MSLYTASHADPKGPGDSRPTALQIIEDNGLEGKMIGKVAVVTGGSSGIGVETVRALTATGLRVFVTVRDIPKAQAALSGDFGPGNFTLVLMDQSSLTSVRDAVKVILSEVDNINILVNNAGIMGVPERQTSKDGYELQFATNHLSHFLLFQLLKPALLAASSTEFQSRVVVVASDAHRDFGLNETGNYNFENGVYHPWSAYAQSKTANIYFASELDRRYGSLGVHAWSVHPGVIATGLGRFMTKQQVEDLLQDQGIAKYWKSIEQGAATTVWAAVGREHEGKGGRYFAHCADAPLGATDRGGYTRVDYTYNPESESRLWRDSLAMVGLDDEP